MGKMKMGSWNGGRMEKKIKITEYWNTGMWNIGIMGVTWQWLPAERECGIRRSPPE